MGEINLTPLEKERYEMGLFLQKCRSTLLIRGLINRKESARINKQIKKEYGSDKATLKRETD